MIGRHQNRPSAGRVWWRQPDLLQQRKSTRGVCSVVESGSDKLEPLPHTDWRVAELVRTDRPVTFGGLSLKYSPACPGRRLTLLNRGSH